MPHTVSATGLALIRKYEGFHAKPTPVSDGRWVVGHNHVRSGAPGAKVTLADAKRLLIADIVPIEALVNKRVKVELTQAQFDALVSFAFSIGGEAFAQSQVLRRINAGEFVAAACAMDAWRKGAGKYEIEVLDALVCRRAAEKALLLKDSPEQAAASAAVRAQLDHAASILGAPPAPQSTDALKPRRQIGMRLTEILRSEPATEALLLTQVVVADHEDEITTAHARPVARRYDAIREATRTSYQEVQAQGAQHALPWLKDGAAMATSEHIGLGALMLLGIVLFVLGVSLLFSGEGGMVDLIGAAALITPGLAAALMAIYGLRRGPH